MITSNINRKEVYIMTVDTSVMISITEINYNFLKTARGVMNMAQRLF